MNDRAKRVVEITAQAGDLLPEGGNTSTPAGALVVVKWAAPALTDAEAVKVRDWLVERQASTSPDYFAAAVYDVLGPDVEVRTPGFCEKVEATIGVVPVLTAPPPSPSEVEAVTRRADAAAQAFVAHVAPPPPDEPFPWDAPAEGFGVATLGDPPSPPLAGYPVDRITSERREHVRAFLACDRGGLIHLPDDAAIDFEAGVVKP
jgi:hypothetical protein